MALCDFLLGLWIESWSVVAYHYLVYELIYLGFLNIGCGQVMLRWSFECPRACTSSSYIAMVNADRTLYTYLFTG